MNKELLEYYDHHKRNLPWRKNKDPYAIWISEILCQQTRVDTAIAYYERFMKDYPSIFELAESSLDDLYKHWQGLGYYSRARNLHKTAKIITEQYNGIFPKDYESLLALPGIGEYTASAILAMAYDLPYLAIDGNFFRVYSRYYAMNEDISKPSFKRQLKEKLLKELPLRSGDFNQAVMDLGATVCLANTAPRCTICPFEKSCIAHLRHNEMDYPLNSRKTKVTEVAKTVFLIVKKDKIILHKRDEEGLLAGLYEFVNVPSFLKINEVKKMFPNASISKEEKRSHHFSHQTWYMQSYLIECNDYCLKENEILATKEEIRQFYSVPKCFNQFFDLLNL